MELILKQDIEKLGKAGDIIKVKAGYGRNYLIPQKLAMVATPSNKKVFEENQRQAAHKIERQMEELKTMAAQLSKAKLVLPVKVGTSGKLFGSITNLQVSRALKDLGFDIDRKDITILDEIKEIGKYKISVKLGKGIVSEIPIYVNKEEETE